MICKKLINGADGETRTLTTISHNHLKVACLPIPPRRHLSETKLRKFNYFGISCAGAAGGVTALVFAAGAVVFTWAFFSAIALTTLPLPSLWLDI